jgi:hypothetical protein
MLFDISAPATALARRAQNPAELARLTSQAGEYIRAGKTNSTLRAYRADWQHFESCAEAKDSSLSRRLRRLSPSTWGEFGGRQAAATLTRRLTSINLLIRSTAQPAIPRPP